MSLQTRLAALISAIGADIKALNNTVPEVYIGTAEPSPRGGKVIWVDTDEQSSLQVPTFVTQLPTNPVDGQEVYFLADATAGVVWHLRYRAAASTSFKWEFVGGPPLHSSHFGGGGSTSAASYTDMGVNLALPLSGDYLAQVIGRVGGASVAAGSRMYTRLTCTTGTVTGNDMVLIAQTSTSNDSTDRNVNNTYKVSGTAGGLLKVQGMIQTAGSFTMFFGLGGIILTPIRVG